MTATVRGESETALAAVRGEEAIEQLKQAGEYDSLRAAVNAARQKNAQLEEPAAPAAVGQSAKLLADDGRRSDFFGISVAVSGDTAIVGADSGVLNSYPGSAYVFTRSGSGWTQQAKLVATGGTADDRFGVSVAISGDTAIVGAPRVDTGDQGTAYVFTRSGSVWTQQAQLSATGDAAKDSFGSSVAISGDTAIVGAHRVNTSNPGTAYVFTRSGSIWTRQAQLLAADGTDDDFFGISVAISGDTAVVGAYWDDVGRKNAQGSAYVFTRSSGIWTQQTKLLANDGAAGDRFGDSVAISGETVIVGAVYGGNSNQGSAYVFTRNGSVWTQRTQLLATGGAAEDLFGSSVAISGDTAVVGALQDDVGTNSNQGSAYVFTRSGSVWTEQAQLAAADGAGTDIFGGSVAISGNNIVVGAQLDDVGANTNQGSAYIFSASTSQLLNISTRLRVETGDDVLIGGFIVTGSAPKKVLLRALGPSLPMNGRLADPTLTLVRPNQPDIFNDNWPESPQAQEINDTLPPSHPNESAIIATLQPGSYTAIVRGRNAGTGVGLVEAYDLDQAAASTLANISTRGLVQTGDDVMIGGFIIGGNTPAKILVRAIGPSLSDQGVQGALQDPTLELVDKNGSKISNDNWRSTQEQEIKDTKVPPPHNRESAILATLAPDPYTAIVRGKGGTTGIALVEVYNLQ